MSSLYLRELSRLPSLTTAMAFHPIEPLIATSSIDGIVTLWRMSEDETNWTLVSTLRGHSKTVWTISFDRTGHFMATGSDDKTAIIYRLLTDGAAPTPISTLVGHVDWVRSVTFDSTGQFVATGSCDNTALVWLVLSDGPARTPVSTLKGHNDWVRSVAFDPSGRFFATCSDDKTARVWRVQPDGNVDQSHISTLSGHNSYVLSIAFDPTGNFLATGSSDMTARIWGIQPDDDTNWTCLAILTGHRSIVQSVAFHPHGLFLVTGSTDKTVKIWVLSQDKSLAKCIDTLTYQDGVNQVQFHPGGKFFSILLDDCSLTLYDCSGLTNRALRLNLLGSQAMSQLVATRLSADPTSTDWGLDIRREHKITSRVDAKNPSLHVPLLTSEEAQAKVKDNLEKKNQSGKGRRITRKKRKINKRHSYRK